MRLQARSAKALQAFAAARTAARAKQAYRMVDFSERSLGVLFDGSGRLRRSVPPTTVI